MRFPHAPSAIFAAVLFLAHTAMPSDISSRAHTDADGGSLQNWVIKGGANSGRISIAADPENPRNKVFRLDTLKANPQFILSFPKSSPTFGKIKLKASASEAFSLEISCRTSHGKKTLSYHSGSDEANRLQPFRHNLGLEPSDSWNHILRDIHQDLSKSSVPNIRLVEIESLAFSGNILLDDVVSLDYTDSDGDLIPDSVEDAAGLDKLNPNDAVEDADNDLVSNLDEFIMGTSITSQDSDDDQLDDYFEIFISRTDPLNPDTDGDGTPDGDEDPDTDGIPNILEQQYGMNPHLAAQMDSLYNMFMIEKTVREDAEHGNTILWDIPGMPPQVAKNFISSIRDHENHANRVIQIKSPLPLGIARLNFISPELVQFKIRWDMQLDRHFAIIIPCRTSHGEIILYYTASQPGWSMCSNLIHHGLGTSANSITTVYRDLQRDIRDARPDCTLLSFNSFIVMGKGIIDNVVTMAYHDTDRDLIPDIIEDAAALDKNNPADALGDINNNGISNLDEFFAGTLLQNNFTDTDSDGLPDEWEMLHFANLDQGPNDDPDNDGLTNMQEYLLGTNPTKADSDGDGINDKEELALGLDPLNPDQDNDGLPDGWEIKHFGNLGQGPNDDPDNDGLDNITEFRLGRHPNAGSKNDSENKIRLQLNIPIK